eukprot:6199206-Pleurochrysis_carterae.AAC.3
MRVHPGCIFTQARHPPTPRYPPDLAIPAPTAGIPKVSYACPRVTRPRARYVPGEDRLGVLSQSLRMRHMAPTAPDTLGCYPFTSHDPFIMDSCPHVYFAANQPAFSSALVEGDDGQRVRVVSVPDFAREPTLVLVNLNTLECTPVTFGGLE